MTNKPKQSAKNAHFSKQEELINDFMKKFRNDALAVFTDGGEPVAFGWKPRDMRDEVETLVNQQVLKALAGVRQGGILSFNHSILPDISDKSFVPLSAIEEIESKYQ